MVAQQPKRRPLSHYFKDSKYSQTHCTHCFKLPDRITLARRKQIVSRITIARLDTLLGGTEWEQKKKEWTTLCHSCGDLYCKEQGDSLDIIDFKQFLSEQTEMSHGTVHEYVARLRRLGNHLTEQNISYGLLQGGFLDENLIPWLLETSTNNYRTVLRKREQFKVHTYMGHTRKSSWIASSDVH